VSRLSGGAIPPWVDPEAAAAAAFLKGQGLIAPDPRTVPIAETRAAHDRIGAFLARDVVPVKHERELIIPGPRDVRCRFYRPDATEPPPLLIYFHGGAFAYGSALGWEGLMRELVHRSEVAILNVDYSLAPEHRFPAGLEDAATVIRHVIAHGREWDIEPTRLALGGDSAGANLALAAAIGLNVFERRAVRFLLLFYGLFSADTDSLNWRNLGTGGCGLSQAQLEWAWSNYLAEPGQRQDWRATPLLGNLASLPTVLQIIGTLDPLIDDAEALKRSLDRAGVVNRLSTYPGVHHGFARLSPLLAKAREAVSEAALALQLELYNTR
jgi:acetyl esterase